MRRRSDAGQNTASGIRRSGYSLLELMIALGLLGGLLALAWSMLGSYRTAEQRGWDQANRMQVIRAVREMIENDVDHWAPLNDDSLASTNDRGSRFSASVGFRGTSTEMSIEMLASIDPLPWLDEVTADPSLDDAPVLGSAALGTAAAGLSSDAVENGQTDRPLSRPLGPLQRVRVQYSLVASGVTPTGDRLVNIRRQMSLVADPDLSPRDSAGPSIAARELTVADLYRIADDPMTGDDVSRWGGETSMVRNLVGARLRYGDGKNWVDSWDETNRGGLPRAIELSFDLPPAVNPNRAAITAADADGRANETLDGGIETLSPTLDDLLMSDVGQASDNSGASDVPQREIRIVIQVAAGVPPNRSSDTSSVGTTLVGATLVGARFSVLPTAVVEVIR